MNNINSQLIHAVVELVIGTCITVWLNRKISTVTQRVVLLENKNKYYENTIVQHHELIKKLFSLLQTMSPETVKITNPSAASASVKNTVPVPVPVPVPEDSTFNLPTQLPGDGTDNSEDELDAILSSEIKDIQIDRTASLT